MAGRSPFQKPKLGRPKVSAAEKKRQQRCKRLVDKLKRMGVDAAYCVIDASGRLWKTFTEFSGCRGAKAELDMSDLPSGSAVVRMSDGVELARRSGNVNMVC